VQKETKEIESLQSEYEKERVRRICRNEGTGDADRAIEVCKL
jgi:hypothetical protein